MSQLGNRIQHGLRAFTPREQKAVRAMAETFRQKPKVDIERAILELGVGEALVSFLDEKGQPSIVERAFILPPKSQIGPIAPETRQGIIRQSLVYGHYERQVDRDSAYEMLKGRAEAAARQAEEEARRRAPDPAAVLSPPRCPDRRPASRRQRGDTLFEAMAKSAARSVESQVGRQILRGVLGSILGGKQ